MTSDTRRALEIIEPLASVYGVAVDADDNYLYVDNDKIGISCNSTWATVNEFVGFLTLQYNYRFRDLALTEGQEMAIKRYWARG